MRFKNLLLILTLGLLAFMVSPPGGVSAARSTNVTNDQPTLNFPESITFRATIESSAPVTDVVLEYGTEQLTCGSVVAKAFPQFTPGATLNAEWTWEMRQSGSLPPGATLWWRWRYTDQNGIESVSEKKTLTWLDSQHTWQTVSSGPLNLHWYAGDQGFAEDLLAAAEIGLARLQNDAGLQPSEPIHLYIYANTEDMKEAILYEPTWTGGMAYADHDIVIIGISQRDLEWGRSTIAHELTHVLVGHLTFSCLGEMPTWLSEGLAMYAEGELDAASQSQLEQAIRSNDLSSVRALSGGFSEDPSRAYLSYSQSYSLVKFLIESYGQDRMNSLLVALRDGQTIDEALLEVYRFDSDGLENAWREAIGAPQGAASAQPTAQPSPTFIPTYVPFAGAPVLVTPTPYIIPTSSVAQPTPEPTRPPLSLTLMLVAVGCSLVVLLGILGLGVFLAIENRKGGDHGKDA